MGGKKSILEHRKVNVGGREHQKPTEGGIL